MEKLQDVRKRFDAVAAGYDKKIEVSKCFGPENMMRALKEYSKKSSIKEHFEILDLGCGTGLCGQQFASIASHIDGVDLSDNMLAKARELGIYRSLYLDDIVSHLNSLNMQYELITSSGVLMYFHDLAPMLNAVFSALKPGGILTFSCDRHDEDDVDVKINPRNDLMFTFSQAYVERSIRSAGLELITIEKIVERLTWKNQEPVPGLVVLATMR